MISRTAFSRAASMRCRQVARCPNTIVSLRRGFSAEADATKVVFSEESIGVPTATAPHRKDAAKAQSSSSATAPASSGEAAGAKQPRKFRAFRPLKAAMSLSPAAVMQLRRLLDQPEPKLIKVGVKQKGCSGLSYDLSYVDRPERLDEVVEQDGVRIVIDNRALMSVIGSEMDWVEDVLSRRFVFRNPNISRYFFCLSDPVGVMAVW
jgi:iron-sulfur cluster assembly 1